MIKLNIVLLGIIILSGCSFPVKNYYPQLIKSDHDIRPTFHYIEQDDGLVYLSCTSQIFTNDAKNGKNFYEEFLKDKRGQYSRIPLSHKYFDLAMLANNAYEDPKSIFVVPEWKLFKAYRSRTGLDMHVYGDTENIDSSNKIAFAFAGTEGLSDWKSNFSFTEPNQYKQAMEIVDNILSKNPKAEVYAVGHSLGGAIAINMSLREPRIQAVVFNPSHRVFFNKTTKTEDGRHPVIFTERGEVLNLFLPILKMRLGNAEIVNLNSLNHRWYKQVVEEHSMYDLARAILHVALVNEDKLSDNQTRATKYLIENVNKETALKHGKSFCSKFYNSLENPS